MINYDCKFYLWFSYINLSLGAAGVTDTLRAGISVSFPFSLPLSQFKNWNSRFWYALLTQCDQVCMYARAYFVIFECSTCQIHGNDFERTESSPCFLLFCFVLYCIVLYCIVMYCIVMYCNCIVLFCFVLFWFLNIVTIRCSVCSIFYFLFK